MGGNVQSRDVWTSSNLGYSWLQSTASAGWSGRHYMAAVSIESTIILMGGQFACEQKQISSTSNIYSPYRIVSLFIFQSDFFLDAFIVFLFYQLPLHRTL